MTKVRSYFSTFLVLNAAVVVTLSLPCNAQDSIADGERWLVWSDEARVAYVSGYVWGYGTGFRDACETAEKLWVRHPKGLPGHDCLKKIPDVPLTPEEFAALITKYYRAYPGDQTVAVKTLVEGLSRHPKLTTQQMHEYFAGTAKHKASRSD